MSSFSRCPKCLAHALKRRRGRRGTSYDCQVCGEGAFVRAEPPTTEKPQRELPHPSELYYSGVER